MQFTYDELKKLDIINVNQDGGKYVFENKELNFLIGNFLYDFFDKNTNFIIQNYLQEIIEIEKIRDWWRSTFSNGFNYRVTIYDYTFSIQCRNTKNYEMMVDCYNTNSNYYVFNIQFQAFEKYGCIPLERILNIFSKQQKTITYSSFDASYTDLNRQKLCEMVEPAYHILFIDKFCFFSKENPNYIFIIDNLNEFINMLVTVQNIVNLINDSLL